MSERDRDQPDDDWVRWQDIGDWVAGKPVVRFPIFIGVYLGMLASVIYSVHPQSPDVLKFFSLIFFGTIAIVLIECFKW